MGERFGKYELIEKIGEGGMAEVWRACATGAAGFQKILVVKKILPMYARNRAFVDMLVAEAKLCSLLVHPNIVSIHELGEIEGVYYIAMEHVDGVDLLQALQRAARDQVKVPTEVALFIAAEVARGLAYAHAAVDPEGRPLNLIHRDVSPANVMVGMRGEVKLMDFGVARADLEVESRRGTAQVVRHDGLKGKLSYMSPELVSGGEIDHRSDLFAVGTLLYEMLTLKRLFMGKSELQTMANVRRARITRRMEKHEYIPDAVQGILRRALAREPEERFQSAVELYEAIGDHLFEARLRVGPAQLAEFVATLFPERALKRASPKLASAPRRGRKADTVQDEGLPAALNAELETRRGSRAQDPDADTLEDEGRDDEDSPEDERDWSERDEEHGPPAPALAQAQPPAEPPPAEPPPPPLPATQSAASAPAPNTTPAPPASPSATSNQKLETTADWLRTWPADTRLSYSLKGYFRGDLLGDARVQWQRVDDQYQTQVAVTIGLFANIRLTSQGRITPTRLWPEVYEENRLGKHRLARMGQQQVTLSDGSTLPRPALLQDTASQFVQLSQDFAFGRLPLKVGAVIPVTLARPGGIDEWIYDVVALDNLATPLGELPAFHLQPRPQPNPRNNVSAEMWFAPSLQHLPVRIRLTLNADTWLDLTVKEVAQTAR